MSHYANGANTERLAKKELEEKSYYVCRSAGSQGIFDLIAIPFKIGRVRVIQIKKGKEPSGDDYAKVADCELDPRVHREMWHRKQGKWTKERWTSIGWVKFE